MSIEGPKEMPPENQTGGGLEQLPSSEPLTIKEILALQTVLMIVWVEWLAGEQTFKDFFNDEEAEQKGSYAPPAYKMWDETGMRERFRVFVEDPKNRNLALQTIKETEPLRDEKTLRAFRKAQDVKSGVRALSNLSSLHDLLEKITQTELPTG